MRGGWMATGVVLCLLFARDNTETPHSPRLHFSTFSTPSTTMSSYASSYASSSDGELPDPYTLLRRPRIATANPPSTAPPPQSPGLFDPPTPPPVKKRTGLQVRSSGGNGRRSPPRKAKAAVVTYREIESGASTATEGSVSAWEPGTSEGACRDQRGQAGLG